ncbi:MAG: cytochrome c oxidase subunit II [Thermomicrobiales bacterium]
MSRFGPRQEDESVRSRRGLSRFVPILALAAVVVLLTGCGPEIAQPYSTISPQNAKTDDIQNLYKITFWASLIVFIGVQAAIAYTALRFRRRGEERPEQVHGSRKLEIAWTIIPAVILLVLFIPTAQTIFKHAADTDAAAVSEDAFHVEVIGKQWWWEISYPNIPANPDDPAQGPLVTANEVILPEDANVVFNLQSNNVIHSFWVPQLSGKLDVMPGHHNLLQFVAERPGVYWGECAEFCGAAHAWMRFKVKVVPREQFDAWVAAWRTPPTVDGNAETADVVEVPVAFGACLACHRINGTNASVADEGISAISGYLQEPLDTNEVAEDAAEDAEVDATTYEIVAGPGPNLTMLACRDTIGAGVLENTTANIETWLKHTEVVKEGVYMPNYYTQGTINDEQVAELAEYLQSLKPAGGCPDDGLLIGSEVATPVVEAYDPDEQAGEAAQ